MESDGNSHRSETLGGTFGGDVEGGSMMPDAQRCYRLSAVINDHVTCHS